MLQPTFKFWPWGALSIAAPAVAALAAGAQLMKDAAHGPLSDEDTWRAAAVFFGIIGAANGYLIAIAIGDLGRSALAIPLGAIAGALSISLLKSPYVASAVTLYFGVFMYCAAMEGQQMILGCFTAFLLSVLLMLIVASSFNNESSRLIHLLLCYPLVCSLVAASMPLERSFRGAYEAFGIGAQAALYSGIAGLFALAGVSILCLIVSHYSRFDLGEIQLYVAFFAGAAVANYRCIRYMFDLLFRADTSDDEQFASELAEYASAETSEPLGK